MEHSRTKRFFGKVLSDQLTRWCCIDRLSWHGLRVKFLWPIQLFRLARLSSKCLGYLRWHRRSVASGAFEIPWRATSVRMKSLR